MLGVACKEWAAVCAAIAAGRQTVLLRKGGIAEEAGTFRVEHPRFWLYPTAFHQQAVGLSEEGQEFLDAAAKMIEFPPAGSVRFTHFVEVEAVFFARDLARVRCLAPWHVLTERVVEERFRYRMPGLFVIAVGAFSSAPQVATAYPEYDGCKTWVPLREPLPTDGATPVASTNRDITAIRAILEG